MPRRQLAKVYLGGENKIQNAHKAAGKGCWTATKKRGGVRRKEGSSDLWGRVLPSFLVKAKAGSGGVQEPGKRIKRARGTRQEGKIIRESPIPTTKLKGDRKVENHSRIEMPKRTPRRPGVNRYGDNHFEFIYQDGKEPTARRRGD